MECNGNVVASSLHNNKMNGPALGMRHLQAALLFFNICVLFMHRNHIGMTLVVMTNAEKSNPDFPEYSWDEKEKSYILSSFYWGYFITQFPGAYCARRFGVKLNLFWITLSTGLLSLLVPFCTSWGGWQAVCFIRFLQGLSQGGVYPAFLQHLANWSPPAEREVLSGFAHTGFDLGTISANLLSGFLAKSSLGWPGTFYTFAAFCFIWCALWQVFGANDFTTSSYITRRERIYIENTLKNSVSFETTRLPVPWKAIFTSKPFYACVIVRAACESCILTLDTELPAYMNSILKLDIEKNALFSALCAVAAALFVYVLMFISHFITKRQLLQPTTSRKCFNSFGMWVPAVCIVSMSYLTEEHEKLVLTLMIVAMASYNGILMGSILNPIDLAPNHTDMIVSIVNMISFCIAFLGPLAVGVIVSDEQNHGQWQTVFMTVAVVLIAGNLVFLIFGTAVEQPWNAADYLNKKFVAQPAEENIEEAERCNFLDLEK